MIWSNYKKDGWIVNNARMHKYTSYILTFITLALLFFLSFVFFFCFFFYLDQLTLERPWQPTRHEERKRTSHRINETFDHIYIYIYLYVCTSSIRIHNQTHKVIIKFFQVRVKNDLAAVAILRAAVSIPAVPYIQGRVVNARLCMKKRRNTRKKEGKSFPWYNWEY
jgi:hypothetical protein